MGMTDNKRKRVPDGLPAMTITTRSSARRQTKPMNGGDRVLPQSVFDGSSKKTRASSRAAMRMRANHTHTSSFVPELVSSTSITKDDNDSLSSLSPILTSQKAEGVQEPKPKRIKSVGQQREVDDDDMEDDDGEVEEEELPEFIYEHKNLNNEDDMSDCAEMDLVSGCRLDSLAQNPDMPLVSDFDDDGESFNDFKSLLNTPISGQPRWPIDQQDDSTTFSILVKDKQVQRTSTTPSPTQSSFATPEPQSPEEPAKEASIEDFVIYSEEDMDEPSIPTNNESAKPTVVPLYGYRDRHNIELANTNVAATNTNRLMAAFSAMSDTCSDVNEPTAPSVTRALYQQAVIAAAGLNRRSLWSGKAREMVGAGVVLGDFFA
ncbi:hypothetical protein TRICI_000478 [Trichomonascus ciferrii]|uniref:Uncharacterized protein n=1 Tax=Trichomonascus ciferrii TaxID=44093 RepID=A0A642VDB1_9ASCO|nr:hypothetical protein TRICI_000478 [Trichomonascus ciferrii]